MYEIQTDVIYVDMLDDRDLYDFSDYPYDYPNNDVKEIIPTIIPIMMSRKLSGNLRTNLTCFLKRLLDFVLNVISFSFMVKWKNNKVLHQNLSSK